MSKSNDGGPAFPTQDAYQTNAGMSLRAWLAGQAMVGMLSCQDFMNEICKTVGSKEDARMELARLACAQADAMIAELALQEEHDAETQP